MIPFVFLFLIVVITIIQIKLASESLAHLVYRYHFDMKLAEPGEKITFSSEVVNGWSFPMMYLNMVETMPKEFRHNYGKEIRDRHRLFLMPHRRFRHELAFSFPHRGVYRKGSCYLEAGDFLGFTSKVVNRTIDTDIVIMPKKCEDERIIQTLGGYLGDVSVRRYILEDPVLTVGFNEYTGHEPLKSISWMESARQGRLMVKKNDYTVDTNVALVLNMEQGTETEREKALEIVRMVAEQLEEKRIPYQFLSNSDIGSVPEGFGLQHLNHLLEKLGRSSLNCFSSFSQLVDRCRRERKNNRSYIFVAAEITDEDQRDLDRLRVDADHELCLLTVKENREL